jgi:uncharacterized protein
MNARPKTAWNPARFDARSFADAGGVLDEGVPISRLLRLQDELHPAVDSNPTASAILWQARGELREAASGGAAAVWLHLRAQTRVSLTCQRCLGPVDTPLEVDRWFRFVADEAVAASEDEDCDEDLLALEPRPDLLEVLEDELLMALPLVPMHEVCPVPVVMQSSGPELASEDAPEPERKNPFSALAKLKK